MLHRQFPASVTQATICAYFRAGIEVGVLPFDSCKDWAFSVIEALDAPPIEIIDVATSNDRHSAMDALQAASYGASQQTAGRWLLENISHLLEAGDLSAMGALRTAMRVAHITDLPQKVYNDFDSLVHELEDVIKGVFGTPEGIQREILNALTLHASAT